LWCPNSISTISPSSAVVPDKFVLSLNIVKPLVKELLVLNIQPEAITKNLLLVDAGVIATTGA
jgi:hypothetical protein